MQMVLRKRIDQLLSGMEWRWSLWNLLYGLGFFGSFAIPAWAFSAVDAFQVYAPASWVAAGFAGVLFLSLSLMLISGARRKWHMTNLDVIARRSHPAVNPLDDTFSNERIFLNDFVLPSRPTIEQKNFMNCEIVGPANIILMQGTTIHDIKGGKLEAVRMDMSVEGFSGYFFQECVFRGCSFHRVTLFIPDHEFPGYAGNQNLLWLASGQVLNQQSSFEEVSLADLYGESPTQDSEPAQ